MKASMTRITTQRFILLPFSAAPPGSGKVIVEVFTDPECPYCAEFATTMDQAMATVGTDKVLYVARVYPLEKSCSSQGGNHFNSCRIAAAARCAGQQGACWEILDCAYTKQSAPDKDETLPATDIQARVTELGMEKGTFNACLESQVELRKVQDDIAHGRTLELKGTHLFYINGVKYAEHPATQPKFCRPSSDSCDARPTALLPGSEGGSALQKSSKTKTLGNALSVIPWNETSSACFPPAGDLHAERDTICPGTLLLPSDSPCPGGVARPSWT
jgi:protein-disulfide isomerase